MTGRQTIGNICDGKLGLQFELPVYLQRSDSGGLDAGIKATYNTGKSKFAVGAFVGLPF